MDDRDASPAGDVRKWRSPPRPGGTLGRWLELLGIFVGFPVGLWFVREPFAPLIVPTLLVTAGICLLVLLRDEGFERRRLGWSGEAGAALAGILRRFVPGAALLALVLVSFRPGLLFEFPRREPFWYAVVMVLYPLLSVYPQELIFRTFFFRRYSSLLGSRAVVIAVNGLVFGLAHLFFGNWIAPTLTTLGGWLFARTYARTGSTLAASLEHALWGDFLFTIGLGWYFWGGSIRAMAG